MMRARVVCRSWLSALTSPTFFSLWSHRSSPSLWLLRYDSSDSCFFAFHPLSKLCLPLPSPPVPYSIVATSQGLICFRHPSSVSLFNPLTRVSLPIPIPDSISPFFHFGFTLLGLPLNRFYIIACNFSRRIEPTPRAKLYDSALRTWVTCLSPPWSSPNDPRARSTQFFVWWNGKFCILLSDRVATYDVHTSQWGFVDLPNFPRIWDSRYMTLHAIRGRLFLEGNFRSEGFVQIRDPLLVGILELDSATAQWKERAFMPKEFARLLCNDAHPLHSKYTSYSDADCDHMCFSPFPTEDKEQLVFYHVEENSWTSIKSWHRGWHSYVGSSNFRGWALQPNFAALS